MSQYSAAGGGGGEGPARPECRWNVVSTIWAKYEKWTAWSSMPSASTRRPGERYRDVWEAVWAAGQRDGQQGQERHLRIDDYGCACGSLLLG